MSDRVSIIVRTRNFRRGDPMKPDRLLGTQRRTLGSTEYTSISAAIERGKIRVYAHLGINEGHPEMGAPCRFIVCMRRCRRRGRGSRRTRVSGTAIYMHLWSGGACDARRVRLVLSRTRRDI